MNIPIEKKPIKKIKYKNKLIVFLFLTEKNVSLLVEKVIDDKNLPGDNKQKIKDSTINSAKKRINENDGYIKFIIKP
jgi:hypothetical protein